MDLAIGLTGLTVMLVVCGLGWLLHWQRRAGRDTRADALTCQARTAQERDDDTTVLLMGRPLS